jgi:hypothetical protein
MIVIERFEGEIAILEDIETCQHIEVDKNKLPENAREGDVVEFCGNTNLYTVNQEKTAERRSKILARLRRK